MEKEEKGNVIERTVVVFDLEATCEYEDKSYDNEVIEIGAVKVLTTEGNNLLKHEIIGEFCEFVKPIKNPILTNFCKGLTHISQENVDNAKLFPEVYMRFINWVGGERSWLSVPLMSWGHYDRKQLDKDCIRHGIKNFNQNHISLKHRYKGGDYGLIRAMSKSGLKFEGIHHRGIDDARNIARVYMANYGEFKS